MDAKLAQINLLIYEKNRVVDLPNLFEEDVFEGDTEACHVPISSPDMIFGTRWKTKSLK